MESDRGGVFWREVYWFVVIVLVGLTIALLVLPPRAVKFRSLSHLEAELNSKNERLNEQQKLLEAAIAAKEDPFYRQNVYRKVLRVKKNDEEY